MLFSVSCEHSIRAMTFLAAYCPPGEVRQVKVIAEELGLSQPTVAKVMHELVRRGLVVSNKGRGGGFLLGLDPSSLRLLEIVEKIDGTRQFDRCILGNHDNSDADHCPLDERWKPIRDQIVAFLSNITLKDLAELERSRVKDRPLAPIDEVPETDIFGDRSFEGDANESETTPV